ncbi:DNA-binding protein [Xanthobacter sp. TB0139]|uniref:DNA-binding protein n=1 Tax=Xanthobacter sp. TB0139 TaxID=3459178 RepID=UPI004039F13E
MDDAFPLTVTIAADEWSGLKMRLRYLEAALIQAYRHERQLKEWFSVSDLLALELPGLPCTRQGLLRRARTDDWTVRHGLGRGGEQYEFHFSSLPGRAFDALIARIIAPPGQAVQRRTIDTPDRKLPDNTAPPWLLPLMRIVRFDKEVGLNDAMYQLREIIPPGVSLPELDELAQALQRFGNRH